MTAKPTLLCVDDEQNVLDVLGRMLDRLGNVITAHSGAEALEILRTRHVDLLLTDQKMPEMTGIQLVRTARAEGIQVITILLTAHTNPNDLLAAINDGHIFRYVTKPWDINDLMMTVRNALAVAQLRTEKDRLLGSLHKRIEALSVMYEVSRQSAHDGPTLDAVIDRLLATVGRVLPHDASAVLLETSDGHTAALRIRCSTALSEAALLHVRDSVLGAHQQSSGHSFPTAQVIPNVSGPVGEDRNSLTTFSGSISVPLVSEKQTVGTLALFSTRPDPYSPDDGELLDLLVNQTTDAITHVRAAERDARLRIDQMVEAMGDGVILTDAQGGVAVVNAAARIYLGFGVSGPRPTLEQLTESLGLSPFELVRGWEYGGTKVVRESIELHGRKLELVVNPVGGPSRELRGLVLVLHDVTEQQLLTQRKDEFVGIISHELRTPLTSIAGALDLVLNNLAGDVTDKQRRFLGMARESAERLNLLVDDLLDLAKFEQGAFRVDLQLIHLDELIRQGVERYGPAFAEKRIEVSLDVGEPALKFLADPNRVNQVINNLLTNAVKFTSPGGRVTVSAGRVTESPGSLFLAVWNSGDVIAEGDLERIFDRFEQARSHRTRNIPGTGLGLSICRTIVEAHGGRIWAEPELDGARFVAVFPEEPGETTPVPDDGPRAARGTVLVLEANRPLAWLLKARLLDAGLRAVLAPPDDSALGLARRLRPEVVLIDPGAEGRLALVEALGADPDTKPSRVVVLAPRELRDAAMAAGASAFVHKPVTPSGLLSSVEAALRERRGGRGRILVVDDDPRISAICAEVLANQGFDVDVAGTLGEARTRIARQRPDLVLLDVNLPDGDGLEFFEALKADRAPSPLSVIFISARGDTAAKTRALKLGGDDYLTKPFDALELGARVESVLRRRGLGTTQSPTTQLPGAAALELEVQRRLAADAPFAFCYLDLDNLRAFNDVYGYAKADAVVRQTADLLKQVVAQRGDGTEFVGHVSGDDFVFIVEPDRVDTIGRQLVDSFDRVIPLLYEREDRERGYIEAKDRTGVIRRFPIMTVSIAAVITDGSVDHPELAQQAAELKKRAKAIAGSVVLRSDRDGPVSGKP